MAIKTPGRWSIQHDAGWMASLRKSRRSGFMPNGTRLYTAQDCEMIRALYPDVELLARLLGRTKKSIADKAGKMGGMRRPQYRWTAEDCLRLRKHWARSTRQELAMLFPKSPHCTLQYKARQLGLPHREQSIRLTPDKIVNQIRARCRFLNLSFSDLDKMMKVDGVFRRAAHRPVSANRAYKAIRLLDGSLNRDGSVTWR